MSRDTPEERTGRFQITVPAEHLRDFTAALAYLRQIQREPKSRIIRELVIKTAKRAGWKPGGTNG